MKTNSMTFQKTPTMFTQTQLLRLSILLIPAFILSMLAACSDEEDSAPSSSSPAHFIIESEKLSIPAEVELPGSTGTRVATYFAKGIQIYSAQQKVGSDPTVYEWVFVSPSADLYNDKNEQVGVHFAGPSWQLQSGDKLNGQAFTPAKAKSVDSNSLDWLLLKPKAGSVSTGIFSNVAYIQRVATTGGKAPAIPPVSATETIGVEYTAVYRFSTEQ